MRPNNSLRWLILAPAIIFAFWPKTVAAEPLPGLNTDYYTIDEIPPVKSDSEYPLCGSEVENNINRSYDGEPYEDCTGDLFMVHMTGFITIPEHSTIEFWLASDDGGEITIGDNTFGVWTDQGCSATLSGNLELEAGSQPLDLWMYENGGATCVMLAWKIDDEDWAIVPDEAFTRNQVASSTTTTEVVTTTTEAVTTTIQAVTTTIQAVTTTTEAVTTTTQAVTTTTTSTTTTTTTVYVAPATTTSTTVYVEPATTTTTTTEPPTTTTESTTTTTEPEPTTTTTEFVDPVPETTVPPVVETSLPETTIPETPPSLPSPDPEVEEESAQLEILVTEEQVDAAIEELLADVSELEPEEIVAAVATVLTAEPTAEQATQLATSVEVLAVVTEEQAEAIFEAVVVEELTAEQGKAIVEAVQDAPKKVREAFESAINVFTGLFDSYVMVGSTIPVEERRTLVAVSSTMVAVGASLRRRIG